MKLNIAKKLKELSIPESLNPIVRIVAYDYLGLSFHKIGKYSKKSNEHQTENLGNAKEALEKTIKLAKEYDDQSIKLWEGYAIFNLGRVLYALKEVTKKENNWRETLNEAVFTRKRWTESPCVDFFISEIVEGLYTEYLHARAELMLLDEPTNVNNYYEQAEDEYNDWHKQNTRVRLATDVNAKWDKIRAKFAYLKEAAAQGENE